MLKMILGIAWRNIVRRRRSVSTILLCVCITVFAVVSVWSVLDATTAGLALSRERQGADVLVYPNESELSDSSMLYSGVAQSVYMPADIVAKLDTDMAESITWQFYLQTLPNAGCCSVEKEYRLVGIDWESDFLVRPWVKDKSVTGLEDGEILVGCNISTEETSSMMILNYPMKVVSSLEPTGTSLDDSVIVNINLLRRLAKLNFIFKDLPPADLVTCAMVRLQDGASVQAYIQSLGGVEAKVVSISGVQNALQSEVDMLAVILTCLLAVIVILCCVTLSSQFRMLTLTRKKEVGYLRSIGMSRPQIYIMFITEFGLISLIGGVAGSAVGAAVVVPVTEWIKQHVALPISPSDPAFLVVHALAGLLLAVAVCALATISPLHQITQISPHEMIAKGDL